MPKIQLYKVSCKVQETYWLIDAETRRRTTAKSTLQTMSCFSSNDVFRRHRTWWQLCSGTDDPWSHPEVTLELESSLWLKDQKQRTVQRANVNHVSDAELQKVPLTGDPWPWPGAGYPKIPYFTGIRPTRGSDANECGTQILHFTIDIWLGWFMHSKSWKIYRFFKIFDNNNIFAKNKWIVLNK